MGRTPYKRAFAGEDDTDRDIVADGPGRRRHGRSRGGRRFTALSGGERQRVLLARAFAQDPDVLVLDEPTNHLDVRHQVELLALLRAQRRTTLVSLHDLNAAASVCDRLHVLHAGRVVASGPPRDVLTPELLAEVFGVRAAVVEHPLTGDPLIAFDHRAPADAPRKRGWPCRAPSMSGGWSRAVTPCSSAHRISKGRRRSSRRRRTSARRWRPGPARGRRSAPSRTATAACSPHSFVDLRRSGRAPRVLTVTSGRVLMSADQFLVWCGA